MEKGNDALSIVKHKHRKYVLLDLSAKENERFIYVNEAREFEIAKGIAGFMTAISLSGEQNGKGDAEIIVDKLIYDLRRMTTAGIKSIKERVGK